MLALAESATTIAAGPPRCCCSAGGNQLLIHLLLQGLRIDYVLCSPGLLANIVSCEVLSTDVLPAKWSDHAGGWRFSKSFCCVTV
jgi:hypothetical protein